MALASLLTSSQKLILNEIHGPCVFLGTPPKKLWRTCMPTTLKVDFQCRVIFT